MKLKSFLETILFARRLLLLAHKWGLYATTPTLTADAQLDDNRIPYHVVTAHYSEGDSQPLCGPPAGAGTGAW